MGRIVTGALSSWTNVSYGLRETPPLLRSLGAGFSSQRGQRKPRACAGASRSFRKKHPRGISRESDDISGASAEAPDRERAEAVAIKQFTLDDDQRSRLLIRERL
jgi:hypothetical protein